MTISLIAFAVILLITYWWANQGAFSALIHLLCVITAGAVSFALWEPLAYRMLSSGAGEYAKGMVLLGLFIGLLLVLRLVTDRLIRANLLLPRAADVTIGAAFGAAAGALSVGILMIGMGFLQSTVTIGDFTGWSRRSDVPAAPAIGTDNAPILPVVRLTSGFFGYLSWGSFTPWFGGGTFDTHMPQLDREAASLYRDSYSEGMGRVSIPPEAVSQLRLLNLPAMALSGGVGATAAEAWGVQFNVAQDGFDGNGQQFILGSSQARLIGAGKPRASVARPLAWMQPTKDAGQKVFFFNSPSNYATSMSSQGEGTFVLLFAKSDMGGQVPKYVEVKGVRFALPQATEAPDLAAAGAGDAGAKQVQDDGATNIDALVVFPDPKYAIEGIAINSNEKGNLITDANNFIIGGEQRFPRATNAMVGADLRVRGFQVIPGQRIIRVDCSAKPDGVRIFPDLNEWVRTAGAEAQNARVALVDKAGAKYFALGMVEDDGDWVLVRSMGGKPLALKDIPIQPIGSGKKLQLHFRVPDGTALAGLALVTPKETRVVNTTTVTAPKDN